MLKVLLLTLGERVWWWMGLSVLVEVRETRLDVALLRLVLLIVLRMTQSLCDCWVGRETLVVIAMKLLKLCRMVPLLLG